MYLLNFSIIECKGICRKVFKFFTMDKKHLQNDKLKIIIWITQLGKPYRLTNEQKILDTQISPDKISQKLSELIA